MTTATGEPSTGRTPGRAWTVRLTGHADRSASVSRTTPGCRMPPRSKDIAALRASAAEHAAVHAKVARIRPEATYHCRARNYTAHPQTQMPCTDTVVLIVRHDPVVGQVWSVEEVCATCAAQTPNASIRARAAPPAPTDPAAPPAKTVPASAPANVPGGFSSPGAGSDGDTVRRPRRASSGRTRQPRRGQGGGRGR
ncbi:hypothetical protein ACSHXN_45370 (plasmid) [Streptomyces sp. HUAS TT11]|uniref:hypothetical protein n=1 Tax=Streptomyces sp. HUAS TT11 TaxID=3447508 RepID=UPI003F6578EA